MFFSMHVICVADVDPALAHAGPSWTLWIRAGKYFVDGFHNKISIVGTAFPRAGYIL